MITFIPVLFILYIAFFLGYYVGKSVPDEIKPAQRYWNMTLDVLLLLMTAMTFLSYGYVLLAFIIPAILLVARYFAPLPYTTLTGILLAATIYLSTPVQLIIIVLCLTLNFAIGATTDKKKLFKTTLWQPGIAIALLLITYLL